MPEEQTYTSPHDDPSAQIWTSYLTEAQKQDRNLARRWKGDMDSILIFAGLFSASVTAFIIESYRTLSPQPEDKTVELLAQISVQLAAMSNASAAPSPLEVTSVISSSSPPTSAIVCNTLWFLSLSFSLASALSATLVEQWVRIYLQATESRASVHERARISAYLYQGLRRFRMSQLVETIPMLLHISLLLFFAGLVEFLRPVNSAMSYLLLGILILCVVLYCGATVIPLFQYDCPYRTPLSGACWRILTSLRLLKYTDSGGMRRPIKRSMRESAEKAALKICDERDQRDFVAMSWTLKTLRQDTELEAFITIIPRAVVGYDYSAKLLLTKLLHHNDLTIRLAHRIPRLLVSCIGGLLDVADAHKRAIACFSAIWSLSMMSVPTGLQTDATFGEPIAFDEFTLRDIQSARSELEAVEEYASSATVVVTRSILDRHLDLTFTVEQELCTNPDWSSRDGISERTQLATLPTEALDIRKKVHFTLQLLEDHVLQRSTGGLSSPAFMVSLNSVEHSIQALLRIIRQPHMKGISDDLQSETLYLIDDFRSLLKQAGFALALEYASSSLLRPNLPHEAFNTMRRLFLRIDLHFEFPFELQARYVKFLREAFETNPSTGTRIPQSIINLMLGLARVLTDKSLAMKAKHIINQSMHTFSTTSAARNALDHLARCVPSTEPPALDLFTSHMYATIRLEKSPGLFHHTSPALLSTTTDVALPRRKYETA